VNELAEKYRDEIDRILAKYPPERKRSAVMPLLHLAQREHGFLTPRLVQEVAELLELTSTEVASIVGYYTLYHDQPGGRYHIQVCTDLSCALKGAEGFLKGLCEQLGVGVGETTADGMVTIEEVTCLAACHRAPMMQVQGDGDIVYHENLSVEKALGLIEELRRQPAGLAEEEVQP
jgi:NADH-quinone oxidoreductase subunit E